MSKYFTEFLLGLTFLLVLAPSLAFAQEAISEVAANEGFWAFLEGAAPAWVVIGLIVLRQIAEVVSKLIPDTAEGTAGIIRKIFKLIAIYVPNKK